MDIGKLRHRIKLERPTLGTRDVYNTPSKTWSVFATVWASISPISGHEVELARSFDDEVTHKIVMRYWPGVTPTMRVNYRGRLFSINGVINVDEHGDELNLFCTESAAATASETTATTSNP